LKILPDLEAPPTVILLDINVPVMDGHEFLEEYTKGNAANYSYRGANFLCATARQLKPGLKNTSLNPRSQQYLMRLKACSVEAGHKF
jgi:CheY-like chemotaxis protein